MSFVIILNIALIALLLFLTNKILNGDYHQGGKLMRQLKKELSEGSAEACYYSTNKYSLNTTCDFKFSGGTFSTELNPTYLFGGYSTKSWNVIGYRGADRCQVSKHMHVWLQRQSFKDISYDKGGF